MFLPELLNFCLEVNYSTELAFRLYVIHIIEMNDGDKRLFFLSHLVTGLNVCNFNLDLDNCVK